MAPRRTGILTLAVLLGILASGFGGARDSGDGVRYAGRIVYLCADHAKARLCAISAAGGDPEQLGSFRRSLQGPPVSSRNGAALGVTTRGGAILLRSDGTVIRPIPGADFLSFSADGRKVAYQAGSRGIFVDAVAGGAVKRVARGEEVFDPALSPDGSQVAFTMNAPSVDVYVVSASGGAPREITRTSTFEEQPTWSPDGRMIACYANPDQPVTELWVMRRDGRGRRRLVANGGAFDPNSSYDWPIVWSPDGTRIAYTGEDGGHYEVYVVDVRSGKRRRLAASFSDAASPSWLPDGKAVAFMSDHDNPTLKTGALEIYTVGTDGSRLRRLTSNRTNDLFPVWQPRR